MADNPQLVVALTARLDQFEKSMREAGLIAEREVKNIEGKIAKGSAIGSFGGVLGAEIVKGFSNALTQLPDIIKSVADIGDIAERIFVSTDALQALRFGIEQTGGSASQADQALQRFGLSIGKAADGTSFLARIFAANNVELKDTNKQYKTQEQLLFEFAKLVKNAADEQSKLTLVAEAFGRSAGPAMIRTMEQIANQGLPNYIKAAKEAGQVIDKDLIDKADEFDRRWSAALSRMIVSLKGFAVAATGTMVEAQKGIFERAIAGLGSLTGQTAQMKAFMDRMKEEQDKREATAKIPFEGPVSGGPTKIPTRRAPRAEAKDDLQRFDEQLSKHNELLKAELKTVGQSVGEQEKARQEALLTEAAKRKGLSLEQALTEERKTQINQAAALKQGEVERAAAMAELVSASKEFGSAMSDAFKGMVLEGQKFDEVLKRLTNRMASKAIDKMFDMMFASSPGGGTTTPFLDLLKGLQARQAGGPVSGGAPYMVGERGPELFVPRGGGMIVPNSAIRGAGGGIQQNVVINDYSGSAQVTQKNTPEGGGVEVFIPAIEAMLASGVSRGRGSLSKSMDARRRGTNLYG